jgi:hypothetical protein
MSSTEINGSRLRLKRVLTLIEPLVKQTEIIVGSKQQETSKLI